MSQLHQHDFFTQAINRSLRLSLLDTDAQGQTPLERWKCLHCEEVHDTEDDAVDCCPPSVSAIYECANCGDCHEDEDDAEMCCSTRGSLRARPVCSVCQAEHPTFEEAVDCHLFLHPSAPHHVRAAIAAQLEAGTSWADALASAGIFIGDMHSNGGAA